MLLSRNIIVENNPELDRMMADSRKIYDQALYFYRQSYFGFIKTGIKTEPLKYYDVLKQVKATQEYKSTNLDIWTVDKIAQDVHNAYWSFIKACAEYKQNPSKFKAKPRLPGYMHLRCDFRSVKFDKSRLRLTGCTDRQVRLPKSGYFITLPPDIERKDIHYITVSKLGHKTKISITYEVEEKPKRAEGSSMGIDLGINNIMAITIDDQPCSWIVKGSEIKRVNQNYNRLKADFQAKLEKCNKRKTSRMLSRLTLNRNNRIKTLMHLYSRRVIGLCLEHNIKTIYIGHNKRWKYEVSLGRRTNQNFVQIPFSTLIHYLKYKGRIEGIEVIEVEESYTSKTDHLMLESMVHHDNPSGSRIHRGLFVSGYAAKHVNADINGAVGMLRKGGCLSDANLIAMRSRHDLGSPKVIGDRRHIRSRYRNTNVPRFNVCGAVA